MAETTARARDVLAPLLGLLRPERRRAAVAVGLGSAASLAAVALATSSAWLIDRAAERPSLTALTAVMCLVQILAFSKAVLRYAERLRTHDLAFRMLALVRVRFFATLARLAPAGLGAVRSGDILARSIDDVDRLQHLYLQVMPLAVSAAVTIIAAVSVAGLLVPSAALALGCGLLLNSLAIPALARHLGAGPAHDIAAIRGAIAGDVGDLLSAAPELAASEGLDPRLDAIGASDAALRRAQLSAAWRRGACQALSLLVVGGSLVALLLLALASLRAGQLPRVDVAVLPVLGLASFESVAGLAEAFSKLPADLEAGHRLLELEGRPSPVREPQAPEALGHGTQPVAFEDATIRYAAGAASALSGFSRSLGQGRHLGIAGPSGSGKSTVGAALLRFVDLEAGRVVLGGTDTARARSGDVRCLVGALWADDHVFAGSIEANLRIARPDATSGELWSALRTVDLADVVEGLPGRLEATVGEDGSRLSGGERQRLCLARLLLRESGVVVLDEPTAHLDEATGGAVLDDMLSVLGDRTILLMSHREDDLARMDETLRLAAADRS